MNCQLYTMTQTIPVPRDEVFEFFASPRNLEAITPPWLRFRIVDQTTDDVREETQLTYRLNVHGLTMNWVSRISEWVPGKRFVDEQIRGPYAFWHHTHSFEDFNGGTFIGDRVVYRLPLAPFGDWVAGRFVASDVRKIFEYRRRRIDELLLTQASCAISSSPEGGAQPMCRVTAL